LRFRIRIARFCQRADYGSLRYKLVQQF
jgi:hypothetical protein